MIAASKWQPADGLTLEPNALKAATEEKRCLALTAGPGAGKTEMLAQRADFLLRTGICRYPKRILAISFKVDASKNLKDRVQQRTNYDLASRFDSHTFHGFAKRIIDRFRPVLTGDDALDPGYKVGHSKIARKQIEFDDLIPLAIQILQKSKVARNAIRQTYSDVFLDEFQDCTNRQYELLKIVFQDTSIRLTAVGDTKQKIMGWAGAMEGIFKVFVEDFSAIPLNMYLNFRSKPRLLRMQNEIIKALDPSSIMPEEQLVGDDGKIALFHYQDAQQEAEALANLISSQIEDELLPPSEIAVLISKQLDLYAEHLMSALKARDIPFRNEQQMQDISTEPIARLIIDYLFCLYGQREPKSWIRLMNTISPFLDDESQIDSRQSVETLLREQKKRINAAESFSGWWDFARAFLKHIGIETLVALSSDYESRDRLKELVQETKSRIEEFLKETGDLIKALNCFSDDQAVRILTFHKSKGLEFESVILMAIEGEIFFGDEEENRCAFFVGVSRAKSNLVLTYADQRSRPTGYGKKWLTERTAHNEYLSYAKPFI